MEQERKDERTRVYDLDRTDALSDSIFAFAMTLLILSISVPVLRDPSSADVVDALSDRAKEFAIYLVSFAVIGSFWLRHHRLFGRLAGTNGRFQAINLAYLAMIAFIPFPTQLLGDYDDAASFCFYATTIALLIGLAALLGEYAARTGLLREPETPARRALRRRSTLIPLVAFLISIPVAVALDRSGLGQWPAYLCWLATWPAGVASDRRYARETSP